MKVILDLNPARITDDQYRDMAANLDEACDRLNAVAVAHPIRRVGMGAITIGKMKRDVRDEYCQTVACVGGWYWLACYPDSEFTQEPGYGFPVVHTARGVIREFTSGADLLARHLGFGNQAMMEDWAAENPDVWGNDDGCDLFCTTEAYGWDDYDNFDLPQVVLWLRGVAERMRDPSKREL